MSADLQAVVAALREHDIDAHIVELGDSDLPNPGIELRMVDPGRRHPDDTLWPPMTHLEQPGEWLWGDRFEHRLDADATVEQIVSAIEDTVRARS